MPIGLGAAMIGSAGIGAIGSGKSADAASSAAGVQASAARNAADLQGRAALYTANRLAPFADIGFGPNGLINQYEGSVRNVPQGVNDALNPLTNSLAGVTPFQIPGISPPNPSSTWQNAPLVHPFSTSENAPLISPTTNSGSIPDSFDFRAWGPGGAQSTLESTPGYQFTREQGLRAVQNSEAAKGRGVSGNALAAAGEYATGLADKTFGEQFTRAREGQGQAFGQTLTGQAQNFGQTRSAADLALAGQQQDYGQAIGAGQLALAGQQQAFGQALTSEQAQADQAQQFYNTYLQSILSPQAQRYGQTVNNLTLPYTSALPGISLAQNAAAGQGNAGLAGATGAGNALTSGAAATAGGIVGSTNALTSGFNNAGNALTNYALLNRLGFFGGGGAGAGGLF